jgi:quercetin dioxygenase-like cupin family protein
MHFDGLCRQIGTVDPQPLARAVQGFGEDAWHEWDERQRTFRVHQDTQTIPLLYDNDMRHTGPTRWPRLAAIEPAMEPVMQAIRAYYGRTASSDEGYFIRIILTRLSPGTVIKPHRDQGESLMRAHRCHVPITTNPLVDFYLGEQKFHFEAGEIWEINNRARHAVGNRSDEGRVHLILDYVVPGERVDDPEGAVVA